MVTNQFHYSKYQQQLNRMLNARIAIDFLNNNYKQYIQDDIDSIYKLGAVQLKKFIKKFPVTEKLISRQSLLFKKPPTIQLNGSDKQNQLFTQIVNDSQFYSVLITINRLVNLLGKVGVRPRYYNGKILFDILTPDKCIVQQVDDYPTQIEQLMYQINNHSDDNNIHVNQNTFIKITKQTISKVQYNMYGIASKQTDSKPNEYGKIPVV